MSILGVIVRSHPDAVSALDQRLRSLPGVDVADPAGAPDGRLVIVIEDSAGSTAAATMGAIALWPEVLNTSLVYECSGPDAPPAGSGAVEDYRAWRGSLKDWATPAAARGGS